MVQIYLWFELYFPLFWGMLMYGNIIQLRIVVKFVLRFEVDISIMLGMKYKGKKLCLSGPQGQFPTVLYLWANQLHCM